MRYLEAQSNLAQIADAVLKLPELMPPETTLPNPHWATPFAYMNDASRDALRAISPIGLRDDARHWKISRHIC